MIVPYKMLYKVPYKVAYKVSYKMPCDNELANQSCHIIHNIHTFTYKPIPVKLMFVYAAWLMYIFQTN